MNALFFVAALLPCQVPSQLELAVSPALDVDYSDAVMADVTLTDAGGGVADARIDFFIRNDAQAISYSPGSLLGTGADGSAGPLRIRFVEGAYGADTLIAADPDGEPYILEARFGGSASHLASQASVTLQLHRESVSLQLLPEYAARLGDVLDIYATLVDDNGDVEEGGSGTSGRAAKPIAGASLAFYVDLNGDGDWVDIDESLGQASTGANGSAWVELDTTPYMGLPRAGFHVDAIRVEFSGDQRYKVAAGVGDLRLEPAALDPAETLIEVDPERAPADGLTRVLLEATLIDVFGNPLGPEDDLHTVRFETSAGKLIDEAMHDPATGHYTQELEAPGAPAQAEVQVFVDQAEGAATTVEFYDRGCGCVAASAPTQSALVALAGLALLRRRRA